MREFFIILGILFAGFQLLILSVGSIMLIFGHNDMYSGMAGTAWLLIISVLGFFPSLFFVGYGFNTYRKEGVTAKFCAVLCSICCVWEFIALVCVLVF